MKQVRTLLFCISLLVITISSVAQQKTTQEDTILAKHKYGLRIGVDISKPIRTLFEKNYSGFEIVGDFRFSKKFYLAGELGNEKKDINLTNINSTTSGSYIKLGVDFNAYNNWLSMNNAIFAGLRYGYATFKHDLNSYEIYTTNHDFPTTIVNSPQQYKGLQAHWLELIVGVKTELFTNFYASINLQLKRKISEKTPSNFDNLYIPGFNKTNDYSQFGVGYGYTLSYLIPIFKK
jgi:hypothetical protein